MNILLDILDAALAAWPVCVFLALFLLAWKCARKLQNDYAEDRYQVYEVQARHEWKTMGYDAWLEQYEREQERER